MVQRWTIEISQLQFVLGGRCPWYAVVRFCSTAAVHFRWSSTSLSRCRGSLLVQTVRQTSDFLQMLYKVVDVPVCRSCRFPCRGAEAGSMVQTVRLTMDFPQLLNTVADVPVVRSCSTRVQS